MKTGDYYYIENRATGMRLDGYGFSSNGSTLRQYKGTTHVNAQWSIVQFKSTEEEFVSTTNEKLNIFPNPTNGKFTIDISQIENAEIVNVEIYSYDGRIVFNQKYVEETEINLDLSLNKGMYFVVVKHQNQVVSKKLLIH
jgi:hypothetical protein